MGKFREQQKDEQKVAPEGDGAPALTQSGERLRKEMAQRNSRRKLAYWGACVAAAIAIPGSLALVNHHLEKTAPQRMEQGMAAALAERAAYDKAHPKCTEVAKTEVHDKEGNVVRTDTREYSVLCEKLPPEPSLWERSPWWGKILYCIVGFVLCVAAVIWGGPMAIFVISAILGGMA